MEKDDYNLYVIAELTYKQKNQNKKDIFPIDWYSSKNYALKVKIIAEALKKDIKIEETDLYQNEFIERIK